MFFQNISDQLDSLNVCIQNWEQQEYLQKSIQEINSFFRQIQNPNEIRCAVLGQKAVGKSLFIQAMKKSETLAHIADKFVLSDHALFEIESISLCKKLTQENDFFVYLIDATLGLNSDEKQAIHLLEDCLQGHNILFVINKADMLKEEDDWDRAKRQVQYFLQKLSQEYPLFLFSASMAVSSENTPASLAWMKQDVQDFFKYLFQKKSMYLHKVLLSKMESHVSQLQKSLQQNSPQLIKEQEKSYEIQKKRENYKEQSLEELKQSLETIRNEMVNEWIKWSEHILTAKSISMCPFAKDTLSKDIENFWEKLQKKNKEELLEIVYTATEKSKESFQHPDYQKEMEIIVKKISKTVPESYSIKNRLLNAISWPSIILGSMITWGSIQNNPSNPGFILKNFFNTDMDYSFRLPFGHKGMAISAFLALIGMYFWDVYFRNQKHRERLITMQPNLELTKQEFMLELEKFHQEILNKVEKFWQNYLDKNQTSYFGNKPNQNYGKLLEILKKLEEKIIAEKIYLK